MRRVSSIVLYVVAGFFLYAMTIMAFAHPDTNAWIKWPILGVLFACSFVAMCLGLALQSFRRWRRDVGITLLSAAGFCAFVVLTFACLFMDEEFRAMLNPQARTLFSDYVTGAAAVVAPAAIGWLLVRADKGEDPAATTNPPPVPPASGNSDARTSG